MACDYCGKPVPDDQDFCCVGCSDAWHGAVEPDEDGPFCICKGPEGGDDRA